MTVEGMTAQRFSPRREPRSASGFAQAPRIMPRLQALPRRRSAASSAIALSQVEKVMAMIGTIALE